jgi:hypothetical protein
MNKCDRDRNQTTQTEGFEANQRGDNQTSAESEIEHDDLRMAA